VIPQSTIQKIKSQVDLASYIQSRGTKLTKKGKEYIGLCPFHDDHKPSLSVDPKKGVWYCHSCDIGGDVIKFIRLKDIIPFEEAVKRLAKETRIKTIRAEAKGDGGPGEPTIRPVFSYIALIRDVFEFYVKTFTDTTQGIEYLKSRCITDPQIFKTFRFGFANGSLLNTIPVDMKKQLKQIGIITDAPKGRGNNEFFHNCIIFPLTDMQGNIINLYGRHITKPQHLYLPGELKGLFYPPRECEEIILTEGIIDALTLWQAGHRNVLAIYGVNGFKEDHINFLKEQRIKRAILCLDGDQAGKKATEKLTKKITELGIQTSQIILPDELDVNEFFLKNKNAKQDFNKLLQATKKNHSINETVKNETIKDGYIFTFSDKKTEKPRQYRIIGMNITGLDRLKVNIKLTISNKFHIDTFDLYSARSRENFIDTVHNLLDMTEEVIRVDLNILIDLLETKRLELLNGNGAEPKKKEMTEEEKAKALKLLKSDNLLKEIQKDFEKCGFIGEEAARLFGYLATVSRFLEQPLGLLIVSRSGAGKSFLQDILTFFVPAEDLQRYTRITGQSLFYKSYDALKFKVLAIAEEKGAEDAIYSVKTLQSDQYLTVAATITDPKTGHKRTEEYKVEGPTVIIITTTSPESLDFETRNRFVILTIDESREQTRRILKKQREEDTLEGLVKQSEEKNIYKKHHNMQRILAQKRNDGWPIQVVNPYSNQLTYPEENLIMRREQKKYLALIKSIAFLHQYQREVKKINGGKGKPIEYIEVTLEDIKLANKLASEILGRSLDELSPHTRSLLKEIKKMVDRECRKEKKSTNEIHFTRRELCNCTGWSYWQVQDHLKQLVELEYLAITRGGKDNLFRYQLLWDGNGEDGSKFFSGLINIDKLKK